MSWPATLQLDYTGVQTPWAGTTANTPPRTLSRTVARHLHNGPLRVLQSLYPEGDAICHNVLVHPPGGLVGGDTLDINITAKGSAHGLITTPGATRFYRSEGALAAQRTDIRLDDQARLEWLPLEALAYSGCVAENHLTVALAPQAEFIGWDVTAFGLPHAQVPFALGSFCQHIEVPGVWLERGRLNAADHRLMHGPLGLAGHACMASVFFISGSKLGRARRQLALDAARDAIAAHPLASTAGATSPNEQVVVVRVLAPVVEPAMQLLKGIWAAWRGALWSLPSARPRIWAT